MGRKTITTYLCDSCGTDVGNSRGLEKFALEHRTKNYRTWQTALTELCASCEADLLTTIDRFIRADDQEELSAMARPPIKETA